MEEKTQKVARPPQKQNWKAHVKAAIPALVILVGFAAYIVVRDQIEKAQEGDASLPIEAAGITPQADTPLDPGSTIDPENPPPLPVGEERQKFDAQNQKLLAESNLSIQEVKNVQLSDAEKAVQAAIATKYTEEDSNAAQAKNLEFLNTQIQTQTDGVYITGKLDFVSGSLKGGLKVLAGVMGQNPEVDASDSDKKSVCWQVRALIPNAAMGASTISGCDGEGFFRDGSGKRFLVLNAHSEESDFPYAAFAFEFPEGAATKVEALRKTDKQWESATINWTKISKSEFVSSDSINR